MDLGILAAAGIYAIEHNIDRLKEDHQKARFFAEEISKLKVFDINLETVQTNIVIIGVEKTGKTPDEILKMLKDNGVLLSSGSYMKIRAVTHLDVSMEDIKQAVEIFYKLFG